MDNIDERNNFIVDALAGGKFKRRLYADSAADMVNLFDGLRLGVINIDCRIKTVQDMDHFIDFLISCRPCLPSLTTEPLSSEDADDLYPF